jgi:hypothetical protein
MLASGGIVDPSNVAALLHVLHMGPVEGIALSYMQSIAQPGQANLQTDFCMLLHANLVVNIICQQVSHA